MGHACIELRIRDTGISSGGFRPQHTFIVYTDSLGNQRTIAGWPENGDFVYGNLVVVESEYSNSKDFAKDSTKVFELKGDDEFIFSRYSFKFK